VSTCPRACCKEENTWFEAGLKFNQVGEGGTWGRKLGGGVLGDIRRLQSC
jgi:hypothetical protein